jgi:WD40 repeat protein
MLDPTMDRSSSVRTSSESALAAYEELIRPARDRFGRGVNCFAVRQISLSPRTAEAIEVTRRSGEPLVPLARATLEQILGQVQSRPFPSVKATMLSSTPSGRIVTADAPTAQTWTAAEDDSVALAAAIPTEGGTFAHPNDGRWLVVWKDDSTRVFDLSSSAPAEAVRTFAERYVTLSPDGRWLVTRQNTEPTLWSLEQPGSTPTRLPAHFGKPEAILFSPSSRRLVTARAGGRPSVWTLPPTSTQPLELGEGFATRTVRFSPDSRWLLVANSDSSDSGSDMVLWDLGASQPASYSLVTRNLAIAEFSNDSAWLASVGWNDVYQITT